MAKANKEDKKLAEITEDLQRVRADFENYRKRTESEKQAARAYGQRETVGKLLPIIDDVKRAVDHVPSELASNVWAQGIVTLSKNLDKSIDNLGIRKIDAAPGTAFDPRLHHAVQFDEESEGDNEVIAEELQSGYILGDQVLREAMVKVKKQ